MGYAPGSRTNFKQSPHLSTLTEPKQSLDLAAFPLPGDEIENSVALSRR